MVASCANCPNCHLHHVWHVALCEGARVVHWTGIRSDDRAAADAQARARHMYDSAADDGLSVAILSDVAPPWWNERHALIAEWSAVLWPSVRTQLAEILADAN